MVKVEVSAMSGTLQTASLHEFFPDGLDASRFRVFMGPGVAVTGEDGSSFTIEGEVRVIYQRLDFEAGDGASASPVYGARIALRNEHAPGYHTVHVVRPCMLA